MSNSSVTIIKPKKIFSFDDLRELWQYRELMFFLTWRDFKVRYKQTVIGIGWAIFQPFVTMVVFSVFFGSLAKMPSDNVPYPIFVYTGLLLWQFFSGAFSDASDCLLTNKQIVTKVYFPRLILPIAVVLTKFVDFFFASLVLIAMMIYYGYAPNLVGVLILPLLILITFFIAVGGGMLLASINYRYRDVRYVLPFFIQLLLFVTPVIYPASIAGKYSWILAFNPMTGVIKAAQAAILGNAPLNWLLLGISAGMAVALLGLGTLAFKKAERNFADIA